MNQVITVKAGVTYDFSFEYFISSVRGQANTIEMYVETLPGRSRLFGQYTASGNTPWTLFRTNPWTATVSGDTLFTMTWCANSHVLGYSTNRLHPRRAVLFMLTGHFSPNSGATTPTTASSCSRGRAWMQSSAATRPPPSFAPRSPSRPPLRPLPLRRKPPRRRLPRKKPPRRPRPPPRPPRHQ